MSRRNAIETPLIDSKGPDIGRQDFLAAAGALTARLGDNVLTLEPALFSTGSYGYKHQGKLVLEIGGKRVRLQANLILTVVHSKGA
jgi:hypothetical protein